EQFGHAKRFAHEVVGSPGESGGPVLERGDDDADVVEARVTSQAREHFSIALHDVAVHDDHIGNESLEVGEELTGGFDGRYRVALLTEQPRQSTRDDGLTFGDDHMAGVTPREAHTIRS